jgi:methyl-accepting chemotaxis protein
MNNARRNELRRLEDLLQNKMLPAATALAALIEEIKLGYDQVRDDEQESIDNLPESLQSSERADDMGEVVSTIEDIANDLDTAFDAVREIASAVEGFIQRSDEAKGTSA